MHDGPALSRAASPTTPAVAAPTAPTASAAVFAADLERHNAAFARLDAIRTDTDGFQWIDETRVSASLLSSYRLLTQYGAANGYL